MKEQLRQALAERDRLAIEDSKLNLSAVLIPIFEKNGKYHIIFTKRTSHLSHHKGQISFPGGSCHREDKSLLETALRESREEIGLIESDVDVLGGLDDAATESSRFRITPFVGVIPYPYHFRPDAFEVEEIFDLPLDALLNAQTTTRLFTVEGKTYNMRTYEVGGRVIWGATAWILTQFLDIIRNMSGACCNS